MAVNKVVLGENTLIDLTADTVSADKLSKGVTAHDMAGEPIVGTMEAGGGKEYTFTDGLTETNGTVKWDLNADIKTGEIVNKEQCIKTSKGKLAFGIALSSNGRIFASGDGCLAGGFGNNNGITAGSESGAIAIGVSDSTSGSIYASNSGSVALGYGTKSRSDYQVVIGKDNIADSSNVYASIIGNGSSDSSRSNATAIDWQGNQYLSGDIYTNCTDYTTTSTGLNTPRCGGKKLATEEYVDTRIPAPPSADGEYNLHCSIVNGIPTYTWKAE